MSDLEATILIVDDVQDNRDLLVRRLKRLGFSRIDEAVNGVDALAAIDAKAYDLVLLDIMMPELDGFGVLDVLKRDGRIHDLPVVVISALSEIEPVVRCIELGADDFVFKPFNPTLLRARVLATFEKKALRDRTRAELKRKQAELTKARAFQLSLVPPRFSGHRAGRSLSIDVAPPPAKEVGGDLVDHFAVGEDLLVLVLGDVSDKGAGSALLMARRHALVRALAGRPDAVDLFRAPELAADLVNAVLAEGNLGCMFITLVLASLDLKTGRLAYVRAGHVPPFRWNDTDAVMRLDYLSGPPLGLDNEMHYSSEVVTLSAGDRLLIVTDGFTEAQIRKAHSTATSASPTSPSASKQVRSSRSKASLQMLVRSKWDCQPLMTWRRYSFLSDLCRCLLTLAKDPNGEARYCSALFNRSWRGSSRGCPGRPRECLAARHLGEYGARRRHV